MRVNQIRPTQVPLVIILALAFTLAGCSQRAEVVLRQPFAPPSQQQMKLDSRWAFVAAGSAHRTCLLAFPLPDAPAHAPRDFDVYLSLPADEGDLPVALDDPKAVRGFLIQEVGELRGKTKFVSGTVACHRVWLHPHLRRLSLYVECLDGTAISGKAYARIDDRELHQFEREFADDVAELWAGPDAPTEAGAPTASRHTSVP